ncbi:MAG: riboflavin biosynthesis protein RibF [Pseudomonadota bacterium]
MVFELYLLGPNKAPQKIAKLPAHLEGGFVCIGNFDGMHQGHHALIARAAALADRKGTNFGILSFAPHPRRYFVPKAPPFLLSSLAQRMEAARDFGASWFALAPFEDELVAMDAAQFTQIFLHQHLHVEGIVVGPGFRFAHRRKGTVQDFVAAGFEVAEVELIRNKKHKISSTAIRQALTSGAVSDANQMLGRPFAITGIVEQGEKIGRTIGFPTANVQLGCYIRPAYGVYCVRVRLNDGSEARDSGLLTGVANLGCRPSIDKAGEPRLEVHLFEYTANLYGRSLTVLFDRLLRFEQKFDNLDALKAQIARDCEQGRAFYSGPNCEHGCRLS